MTDCKGKFGNEKYFCKNGASNQRRIHISFDLLRNAEMFDTVITSDEIKK